MIGIIGAMDEEVKEIKELLHDVSIYKKAGMEFFSGSLHDKNVVIVRSGIGKVNAAVCTQILIDHYNAEKIINTGIAGSLNADINIGDIVISEDVLQHDIDAVAFGYEPGVIPRMETSVFPADRNMISIAGMALKKVAPQIGVFEGRVVTGDQFISDSQKKDWIASTFTGDCTEMEGGAIAQTAYLNKVPFVIIRAISDKADNSASMDYPAFEAMAIKNLVLLIDEFINDIE